MSDCGEPLNLGTEEMLSMNEFAALAMSFEGKKLPIQHIPGPQGVRGRNSDNTLIKARLGWEPNTKLEDGMRKTYFWIKEQVEKSRQNGVDINAMAQSKLVVQDTSVLRGVQVTGYTRAADGSEKTTLDTSVCCNGAAVGK